MLRVLFAGQHNSACGQMTVAYLSHLGGDKFLLKAQGSNRSSRITTKKGRSSSWKEWDEH